MNPYPKLRRTVVGLVSSIFAAGCASTSGFVQPEIDANRFTHAVVSDRSVQPDLVAHMLVERGLNVVLGSAMVDHMHTGEVPPHTVLLASCLYLGHSFVGVGTAARVECTLSDLATGAAVYTGRGQHMGLTHDGDLRGATEKALAAYPATGRTGRMAQTRDLPGIQTRAEAPPPVRASAEPRIASTGTGFFVDSRGHLVTNAHVVQDCRSVRRTGSEAVLEVIRMDPENDLALLRAPGSTPSVAAFRGGRGVRSGDAVVAVGFPLSGLLASEANVTTGTISALAGIRDDFRFLQITAPVQPGNSGGPLLDESGNVVGVVTSKLNAVRMAQITGDIPQNINFAVNASVVRMFLDAIGIEYRIAASPQTLRPADIGDQAKLFTVLLQCWR
jgi:S1-C subfamily serine protease